MITVHAHVDGRALHVLGLVLLACQIRNSILVHPGIGGVTVASLASAGVSAINQGLNGRNNVTSFPLRLDLKAISDGGEGRVSPAGATIDCDRKGQKMGGNIVLY